METYAFDLDRELVIIRQLGVTSQTLFDDHVAHNRDVYVSSTDHNTLKLDIIERNTMKWGDSIQPNTYFQLNVSYNITTRLEWNLVEII